MLPPARIRARLRAAVSDAANGAWDRFVSLAAVGPDDARGRRFRSMGFGSCLAFPRGAVFGERWIALGSHTLICPHVTLSAGLPGEPLADDADPIVVIGDRCSIGRGSSIVGRCRIEIGDDVSFGPGVYVTDHNHTYDLPDVPIARQWPADAPVRIGSGSWLATGVTVLPGTDIGRNVAVAANSVVRGVVPDHCVVAGAPARIVRRYRDGAWQPPFPPRSIDPPEGWTPE